MEFHFCSIGKREPIRPPWTANLGEMVRVEASCRAMCTACDGWRDVDLARKIQLGLADVA